MKTDYHKNNGKTTNLANPTVNESVDRETRAILQTKGIIESENVFSVSPQAEAEIVLNGTLCLEVFPEGKKQKVIAKTSSDILALNVINLADREKRLKFLDEIAETLPLTDDQKTEVLRALIKIAGNDRILKNEVSNSNESKEPIETSFQILKDGRIIEQISSGFAMFDPENGKHSVLSEVKDIDGTIYKPIVDDLLQKSGGIQLANELTEYGTDAELIADIEKYLSSYLDLKPLFLRLTALYILFTYMFDRVLELSYLNPTGDPGSGKSRFGLAVCYASRRGLFSVNPSASSVFRIVDKFQPTLFIDEFNSDANSDDAAAIIQILNAGFQGVSQIPRQVGTTDGKFKTELFNPYCPKIIGSLKQSASNAFNSRCVEIQMERTVRNDLPLRLSFELLKNAQIIRNKLTLWRLRNIQTDFEAKLDKAELDLKKIGIMPRSIQINIPLFALINDETLRQNFIDLLLSRDNILVSEKQNTFDGELIKTVYDILFESEEESGNLFVTWKIAKPIDGKICEHIRTEKITAMLNASRDKDILNERYVGKRLSNFGFHSKQIKIRDSEYFNKSAMIFDAHRLAVVFNNYGLPVPGDFSLDSLEQSAKSKTDNGLNRSKENVESVPVNHSLEQSNFSHFNNNGNCSNESKENSENRAKTFIDEVI